MEEKPVHAGDRDLEEAQATIDRLAACRPTPGSCCTRCGCCASAHCSPVPAMTFYASGLINDGCDVVTVQRAMGHRSATVTLNTYAHKWPEAEDRTRKAAAGMFADAVRDCGPTADRDALDQC